MGLKPKPPPVSFHEFEKKFNDRKYGPVSYDYYGNPMRLAGACPWCKEISEWGIEDKGLVTFICLFCDWCHRSLYKFNEPGRWISDEALEWNKLDG